MRRSDPIRNPKNIFGNEIIDYSKFFDYCNDSTKVLILQQKKEVFLFSRKYLVDFKRLFFFF